MKHFLAVGLSGFVFLGSIRVVSGQGGAQLAYTAGIVIDSATGAGLAGATIEISPGGSFLADGSGHFGFGRYGFGRLRPGTYMVRVSHVGYASYQAAIQLPSGPGVRIALRRIPLFMEPVEVKGAAGRRSGPIHQHGYRQKTDRAIQPRAGSALSA